MSGARESQLPGVVVCCVGVCVLARACVNMRLCVFVCRRVCVCVRVRAHAYLYVCLHARVRAWRRCVSTASETQALAQGHHETRRDTDPTLARGGGQ